VNFCTLAVVWLEGSLAHINLRGSDALQAGAER
jgi:hypothetical protein